MVDSKAVGSSQAQQVLVALPAEIDVTNADGIGQQLTIACAPGVRVVIADMTVTTFCDSGGFRMLLIAHRTAAAHGTDLRLLLPHPNLWRVIHVLGVDTVLPVYHSLQEALTG